MLKIWDLAKKSHFASVLATEAVNANFLHTMMNYIENGIHHQFLKKNVDEILTRQRQLLLKNIFTEYYYLCVVLFYSVPKFK